MRKRKKAKPHYLENLLQSNHYHPSILSAIGKSFICAIFNFNFSTFTHQSLVEIGSLFLSAMKLNQINMSDQCVREFCYAQKTMEFLRISSPTIWSIHPHESRQSSKHLSNINFFLDNIKSNHQYFQFMHKKIKAQLYAIFYNGPDATLENKDESMQDIMQKQAVLDRHHSAILTNAMGMLRNSFLLDASKDNDVSKMSYKDKIISCIHCMNEINEELNDQLTDELKMKDIILKIYQTGSPFPRNKISVQKGKICFSQFDSNDERIVFYMTNIIEQMQNGLAVADEEIKKKVINDCFEKKSINIDEREIAEKMLLAPTSSVTFCPNW